MSEDIKKILVIFGGGVAGALAFCSWLSNYEVTTFPIDASFWLRTAFIGGVVSAIASGFLMPIFEPIQNHLTKHLFSLFAFSLLFGLFHMPVIDSLGAVLQVKELDTVNQDTVIE